MTFYDITERILTFYDAYCIIKIKGGEKMPINDFEKFRKYAPIKNSGNLDAESTMLEIIENAEKFYLKGVELTLLSEDFFDDCNQHVSARIMSTKSIVPPHNHDYYEINYVIKGKCAEYIGDKAFFLEEGDFLIMSPSVVHASGPVKDSVCANILIKKDIINSLEKRLTECDFDNYLTRIRKHESYIVFKAKSKNADSTAKDLLKHCKDEVAKNKYHNLYAESITSKMLIELSECKSEETSFSTNRHFSTTDISVAILQHIRDNIAIVTLESVSNHFGYSPAHLSRIIKKHTGNSFSTFIMLQRIIRAEQLLSDTNIPIGKIPAIIGLDSKEYFSRVFKRFNNISPSEFRKKHRI